MYLIWVKITSRASLKSLKHVGGWGRGGGFSRTEWSRLPDHAADFGDKIAEMVRYKFLFYRRHVYESSIDRIGWIS